VQFDCSGFNTHLLLLLLLLLLFCADNLVSKLNAQKTATAGDIIKEMGLYNLFTRGLGLRIIMIGTLTGLQVCGCCVVLGQPGSTNLRTASGAAAAPGNQTACWPSWHSTQCCCCLVRAGIWYYFRLFEWGGACRRSLPAVRLNA
jgi:hypothetical protein